MLDNKMGSIQKNLKSGLLTLIGISTLLTSVTRADDYSSTENPKSVVEYSQEYTLQIQDREPTREDYLDRLKEVLGDKYLEIKKNPKKKKLWDENWETESEDVLKSLIRIYINPVKLEEQNLSKVNSKYTSELIKDCPWINSNRLTPHDKKFIKQTYTLIQEAVSRTRNFYH